MSHERTRSKSVIWLTPPSVIDALGGWRSFDLDPCAAPEPRPWPTALRMNAQLDGNGLLMEWSGRVWLNPPYGGDIAAWLAKMAQNDQGTALLGVRSETEAWQVHVWPRASGMLFLDGRLRFCRPDGKVAKGNAGHASALVAYGPDDLERLAAANIAGHFQPLRFARYLLVEALSGTWGEEVRRFLESQRGPVSLGEAYRHFSRHPKARRNRHWQAKVRQQLQAHAVRVAPGRYQRETLL